MLFSMMLCCPLDESPKKKYALVQSKRFSCYLVSELYGAHAGNHAASVRWWKSENLKKNSKFWDYIAST